MRITNSMMVDRFLSESNDALGRVAKYQSQVDSTKRISSISDDPQATITALKARNKLTNLALYQSNIKTASGYLTEAESAVDGLNDVLQSVYSELIDAQSGAKTQDELNIIAEDIKNLQEEVLAIANGTLGTSYIFGGYNYTGQKDGVSKTPPFSVDSVTGDLIYNGINLSSFSYQKDFQNNTSEMTAQGEEVLDIASEYSTTQSDYSAKQQAKQVLEHLNNIVSCGQDALDAAVGFGIDKESDEYKALSGFVSDLTELKDSLDAECNKELAGDYILDTDVTEFTDDGEIDYEYYSELGKTVLTLDEFNNKFSSANAQAIIDSAAALFADGGTGSVMDEKIAELDSVVIIDPAVEDALTMEEGKNSTLQIGVSQTVDVTLTGIELLGKGDNNIYHLLGQCVKMLSSGDTESISGMITSIQDAQSAVLTLETKIGSSINRLDMTSSRYSTSELNYTEMRSNAEDADMAEAIMNLTTANTVYNAALAGGAQIIQTSLIDFLQ